MQLPARAVVVLCRVMQMDIAVAVAADAPHSALTPYLAESYSSYPTYDHIMPSATEAFRRRFLTIVYRDLVFSEQTTSDRGVCITAVDRTSGEIMGSLFVALRTFDQRASQSLSDPADTFGLIWRDIWRAEPLKYPHGSGVASQRRQPLRDIVRVLRTQVATCWLACMLGPWALRRLLRYGARGRELNRRFAVALAGGADAAAQMPAAMWRVDHVFVRQHYRRRGVCRRLFQAACEGADEAGATLYLSTSAAHNSTRSPNACAASSKSRAPLARRMRRSSSGSTTRR